LCTLNWQYGRPPSLPPLEAPRAMFGGGPKHTVPRIRKTWQFHAAMRFLRFQAPWAYGGNVFALLRKALVGNWANIRYRRMDVAENRHIRGTSRHTGKPKKEKYFVVKNHFPCREKGRMEALRSRLKIASGRAFYTRIGVGLLTKFCKRPHPRSVVFGIIARCYRSVVASGVVLPVRALEGRLKTGVSPLPFNEKVSNFQDQIQFKKTTAWCPHIRNKNLFVPLIFTWTYFFLYISLTVNTMNTGLILKIEKLRN